MLGVEQQVLGTGLLAGEQVDELVGVVVADRAVERGRSGQAVQSGVLVVELVAVARDLAQRGAEACGPVARQTDQGRLLVERPADGLADPEGGVGRELEALAPVELVHGVLQAEVALLDQVQQLHARRERVAAGDADHEAEVGPDEPVLRCVGSGDGAADLTAVLTGLTSAACRHPGLDELGELALLLGGEQGDHADLVEVHPDGVTHGFQHLRLGPEVVFFRRCGYRPPRR